MNVNKINDELHVENLQHKYSCNGGREGKCQHIKNNRLINNCHYNPFLESPLIPTLNLLFDVFRKCKRMFVFKTSR